MKNLFYLLFISLFLSISLPSCSSDDILPVSSSDDDTFCFEINLPSEIRTRAYGDGSGISTVKYYAYAQADGNNAAPFYSGTIAVQVEDGKKTGSMSIQLPNVGKYDFVFLASSGNCDDSSGKVYYNKTDRTLNVNYAKISTFDEDVDCFFAVLKDVDKNKGYTHTVTLKRPFAQLNIGTTDLADYNAMSSSELSSVGVTVDGVYSSMNVMDGSVIGSASKVAFAAVSPVTSQTFPVADNTYLTMNYLLVNERKNVDVTFAANNGAFSFSKDFTDVPLQRNHQTNIYGSLLTTPNDFKVEINPGFGGSENNELNTIIEDYDLILESNVGYTNWDTKHLSLVVEDEDGNVETYGLKNYMDSQGTVKIKWSDLGITNAVAMRFNGSNNINSNNGYTEQHQYIRSLIKCNLSTFNIRSLNNFFAGCQSLTEVPAIAEWDTSNITDMSNMFAGCLNLQELDLSNFNTEKVINMDRMFYFCNNLKKLNLNNFDTSNITTFEYMFYNCSSLMDLDLTMFNTENVKSFQSMFEKCTSLANLDVSKFDTRNAESFQSMFENCSTLTNLDVSNFRTNKVVNMSKMFKNCQQIEYLDVSKFDTSNVETLDETFYYCSALKTLDISQFDTSNVQSFNSTFCRCNLLTVLDVSNFNTSNATNMGHMFSGCENVKVLDVSKFNTSNVTFMARMFSNCYSITSLDLSNFDTSKVTSMSGMFNCDTTISELSVSGLDSLDVSNFDTSSLRDMSYMFMGRSELKHIDISNFRNAVSSSSLISVNVQYMFCNCSSLLEIDVSALRLSTCKDFTSMFQNCSSLESINISNNFYSSRMIYMNSMFEGCTKLKTLDVHYMSFWKNVKANQQYVFKDCISLTELRIPDPTYYGYDFDENSFINCPATIIRE